MLVALYHCAINENRYSVDYGRGICPLFVPTEGHHHCCERWLHRHHHGSVNSKCTHNPQKHLSSVETFFGSPTLSKSTSRSNTHTHKSERIKRKNKTKQSKKVNVKKKHTATNRSDLMA